MKQARSERTVRQRLTSDIAGKTALGAFNDWFIPATWDIDEWASDDFQKLVHGVKGRLAEFDNGAWTEPELREQLEALLREPTAKLRPFTQKGVAAPDMASAKRHRRPTKEK